MMFLYAITLLSQQTPIHRVTGVHVTEMVILNLTHAHRSTLTLAKLCVLCIY